MSGFPAKADSDDEERDEARKLIVKQNRKNKKSGGFQSMGKHCAHFISGLDRFIRSQRAT